MTTTVAASVTQTETNNSIINGTATTANPLLPANTSFHENTTGAWNTTLPPLSNITTDGQDFFHHLSLKDETTFVAIIVMGVVVPAIFIAVFILIFRQRRKDLLARRTQMLLQNAQDFALEDYTTLDKATRPPPKL